MAFVSETDMSGRTWVVTYVRKDLGVILDERYSTYWVYLKMLIGKKTVSILNYYERPNDSERTMNQLRTGIKKKIK